MSLYVWVGVAGFVLTFGVLSAFGRDPYFHPDRRWILLLSGLNAVQLVTIAAAAVVAFRTVAFAGFAPALVAGLAAAAAVGTLWLWVNVRTVL